MSLDLHKTSLQLEHATMTLVRQRADQSAALQNALGCLREIDSTSIERRRTSQFTWLAAGIEGAMAESISPPISPSEYIVVATDGSHIDVSRHVSIRTSLINIGQVALRYGELPDATLRSTPILYADDSELVLLDPDSGLREQPLEGPLLGIKRAVMELEALADLVDLSPPEVPILALIDGSLVLFGLGGQGFPDYVRRELLDNGLVPALDRLRDQASRRTLAVASYISLPGAKEVVNTLRLHVCPHTPIDCDWHCKSLQRGLRPCDSVNGVRDRDLFEGQLGKGHRTPLFRSLSSVVTQHYGDHQVLFFYVHTGTEVARVEMPAWSALSRDTLNFAHASLVDQISKGHGYPVALSEAHEQAVVTGQDRQHFDAMIEDVLTEEHFPVFTSEKARTKRTRYV